MLKYYQLLDLNIIMENLEREGDQEETKIIDLPK